MLSAWITTTGDKIARLTFQTFTSYYMAFRNNHALVLDTIVKSSRQSDVEIIGSVFIAQIQKELTSASLILSSAIKSCL